MKLGLGGGTLVGKNTAKTWRYATSTKVTKGMAHKPHATNSPTPCAGRWPVARALHRKATLVTLTLATVCAPDSVALLLPIYITVSLPGCLKRTTFSPSPSFSVISTASPISSLPSWDGVISL